MLLAISRNPSVTRDVDPLCPDEGLILHLFTRATVFWKFLHLD